MNNKHPRTPLKGLKHTLKNSKTPLKALKQALTAQQKSGDSARRALLAACGTPNAVPYVAVTQF